jgi:hypothetical protein
LPEVDSTQTAVLYTLAYADIFDYAPTLEQLHRYLIGRRASLDDVAEALAQVPAVRRTGPYYYLRERDELVELRKRRAEISARAWPRALRYGAMIARLPFVRMVSLTGALAVNNAKRGDDIDYLIATERGRLWLSRALVIALVVRPVSFYGDEVCPNYFVAASNLDFDDHDLYTAHELAQMVPLYGRGVYDRMRRANEWVGHFLPNASGAPPGGEVGTGGSGRSLTQTVVEPVLRSAVGATLESWEMRRKIPRLTSAALNSEVSVNADLCKGHVDAHHQWARDSFRLRLEALGLGGFR